MKKQIAKQFNICEWDLRRIDSRTFFYGKPGRMAYIIREGSEWFMHPYSY